MDFDQRNRISGKQVTTFQNGQLPFDNRISALQNKRDLLLPNRNGLEIRPVQVNGNSGSNPEGRNAAASLQSVDQRETTNGLYIDGDEQMDYDDDDIYNFDSDEDYSDDEGNDSQGMIAEVYSLADEGQQIKAVNDAPPLSGSTDLQNQTQGVPSHEFHRSDQLSHESSVNDRLASHVSEPTSSSVAGKHSEHGSLLKARADAREHLRKLSQSLRMSNPQKMQQKQLPSPPSHDTNSSPSYLEKRLLDTSSILNNKFERRDKSKTNVSFETHKTPENFYNASKTIPKDESGGNNNLLRSKLSDDPDATCAAYFLSQSVRENSRAGPSTSKPLGNVASQVLVPRLNDEGGYFSIEPRQGELEEEFIFSVTFFYAKNLSKILPKEVSPLLNDGFRFHYCLMGCSIYTDPFKDLDNPEFLGQKASAVIRSSHQTLSTYFTQHYSLPIYFLNGDVKLGVCVIDILQLSDIANSGVAKVEDVYEVNSVNKRQSRDDGKADSTKSVIAVSFEVVKSTSNPSYYNVKDKVSLSERFPELNSKTKLESSLNEIEVSDSMSSGSDDEEKVSIFKSLKRKGKGKLCYGCRSGGGQHLAKVEEEMESHREAMKQEIVRDLDRWKKQKKKQFMKELAAQEETLQKLLASEWSSKTKIIQEELSHRLAECDKLQEKLNSALSQLSVREEKLNGREKKVIDMEREVNEKLRTDLETKLKSQTSVSTHSQMLLKQLATEKSKNSELHTESSKLKEDVRQLEETVQSITQELFGLRRKLIQTDEIIGISKEKEMMEAKIENLVERKQYYKTQWVNTLTDLHKLHSAHKNVIEEISSGGGFRTPATLPSKRMRRAGAQDGEPSTSEVGSKLRKLTGERKILLESGIYPPNHSIIKKIDKKIQDLID